MQKTVSIQSDHYTGQENIDVKTGEVTVVTGPNGVGKSAILDELYRGLGHSSEVEILTGHRQIYFNSDDTDQVGQSLANFAEQLRTNPGAANRFRNSWGEQHLKSIIRRILNYNSQASEDVISATKEGMNINDALIKFPRAVDIINTVFSAARLVVRVYVENGQLKATRNNQTYGIDRLSDGERAALLLVGAVMTRPLNTFIIIDEPERHLNPSISALLIKAVVRSRSDLGFIFATHDLQLIEWLHPEKLIHVKESQIVSPDPEVRKYSINNIDSVEGIGEDLKYSILGSRKALLVVEGEVTSEDRALYTLVYPGWNVIARGGWESVSSDVRSLKKNDNFHWLTVAGIVDGDGRTQQEKQKLLLSDIYSLPSPTIENLFFYREIIEAMAEAAHQFFGKEPKQVRIDRTVKAIPLLFNKDKVDIVSRRVVWKANRILSENKVSFKSITNGQKEIPPIDLESIRKETDKEFDDIMNTGDPYKMIMGLPIKNTTIPAKVSSEIGFGTFDEYKNAVIAQVQSKSKFGIIISSTIENALPGLPNQ